MCIGSYLNSYHYRTDKQQFRRSIELRWHSYRNHSSGAKFTNTWIQQESGIRCIGNEFTSFDTNCIRLQMHSIQNSKDLLHMLKTTESVSMFCDCEAYDLVKGCLIELSQDFFIWRLYLMLRTVCSSGMTESKKDIFGIRCLLFTCKCCNARYIKSVQCHQFHEHSTGIWFFVAMPSHNLSSQTQSYSPEL